MRVALAGATGLVGRLTSAALSRDGHDVVGLSRASGVDLTSPDEDAVATALDDALRGVDAVVDVTSTNSLDRDEVVAFFSTATERLLASEQCAGIGHHVVLSIVNVDRAGDNAHYAGKQVQEQLVADGPVPWSIVRATQFHEFAEMVVAWTTQDGSATLPPLLMQPVAAADVAAVLAEVATGAPVGRYRDLAGPDLQDLVDMARRALAARGTQLRLVPSWAGLFDESMAGNVLLPGDGARIAPTTFEDWLNDSVDR